MLAGLRRICRAHATLEIVLALPLAREARALADLAGVLDEAHLHGPVAGAFAAAGFDVGVSELRDGVAQYATTWSRRLSLDPARRFFLLHGRTRAAGA